MHKRFLCPRTELIYELLHSSHVSRILTENVNSILRVNWVFLTPYLTTVTFLHFLTPTLAKKLKIRRALENLVITSSHSVGFTSHSTSTRHSAERYKVFDFFARQGRTVKVPRTELKNGTLGAVVSLGDARRGGGEGVPGASWEM